MLSYFVFFFFSCICCSRRRRRRRCKIPSRCAVVSRSFDIASVTTTITRLSTNAPVNTADSQRQSHDLSVPPDLALPRSPWAQLDRSRLGSLLPPPRPSALPTLIPPHSRCGPGKVKAEELSGQANAGGGGGGFQDANPFLPATEAQRMMGGYPDGDVARASLAQMNEISRRAEVAGMSFNAGAAAASASSNAAASGSGARQAQGAGVASSMSRIMAAAAGLGVDAPVRPMSRQDALARIEELSRARPASAQGQSHQGPPTSHSAGPSHATSHGGGGTSDFSSDAFLLGSSAGAGGAYGHGSLSHEGLQVFTVGHLMPKSALDDENGNWAFDANALNAVVMPTPQGMGGDPEQEDEGSPKGPYSMAAAAAVTEASANVSGAGRFAEAGEAGPSSGRPGSAQKLRVRRSTYVPGWAVPPRVLLVDDDAVSRRLSSKFLQVFGCTIDVAVDGVGAVNKMNLEKYDLVLMVSARVCDWLHDGLTCLGVCRTS